jgi:hypothetical protein
MAGVVPSSIGAKEGSSSLEKNGVPAKAVVEVAATKTAVNSTKAAWRMACFMYEYAPKFKYLRFLLPSTDLNLGALIHISS